MKSYIQIKTVSRKGILMAQENKKVNKIIAQNKKAYHDYFVDDRYEAGLALFGTEIKSIRSNGLNLKDSYCICKDGELWLIGMHISPYQNGSIFNRQPLRDRKLLMHKKEILKINGLISQKGVAVIPLSVYYSNQRVKVEIGICRGKKAYDKRDSIAKDEAEREIERRFKSKNSDDGYD